MNSPEILLHNLNPAQRKAVETLDGPVLILAGAGSGKTRVLTHRMANLIANHGVGAGEILCVTFTNKAAKEMEHRIFKILSDLNIHVSYRDLWVSTFHTFCVRLLRQHIEALEGFKNPFTIYDSGDQLALIKRVLAAENISSEMYDPKYIQNVISKAKMEGKTADKFNNFDRRIKAAYTRYEQEMKRANALDFDDLLLKTYQLFEYYPDTILADCQDKFRYIMVDEYQDTNHIQYLLVQMLAKKHHNLCVVGDEDQSIYSWRGADISNILDFEKDFPDACVVKLEENYRSTANIVKAASALISNNTERKEKTLFTSNADGEPIQIHVERSEYDEARFITKTIQSMISSGESDLNNYAIFYRTNAQSRVLEDQFRLSAIPYRLIGGMRFYERAEIKDMISYLRLTQNVSDDMALKRIINVPARGIGKTTVEQLEVRASQAQTSLYVSIDSAINEKFFNAGTTAKLRRFLDLIEDLREQKNRYRLSEFYSIALDRTEYKNRLESENTPESDARIENLKELDNAINQFENERGEEATLSNYLEELTLASDLDNVDNSIPAITMMTLHVSKGLEFPYVFIVGCEEGLFPSIRGEEQKKEDLEEERRLAYVGMTRARQKLWMTYAQSRRTWGTIDDHRKASQFFKEIPKQFTAFSSAIGLSTQSNPRFMQQSNRYGSGGYLPNYNQNNDDYAQTSYDDDYSQVTPQVGKASGYAKGQRVRHPTFGVGSIFSTEGAGDNLKISVLFQDNTVKKFVAKYARLEKV